VAYLAIARLCRIHLHFASFAGSVPGAIHPQA
jgi:hypothetical protein